MGRRSLSLVALGWSLSTLPAQAAAPPRLHLRVKVCAGSGLDTSELERSLRTELDADGWVQLSDANVDAELFTDVGCDAALSTSISLTSTRVGWHSERVIVLGDASPGARAGVLALAAAELVRSGRQHLSAAEPSRGDYPSEPSTPVSKGAEGTEAVPPVAASAPPAVAPAPKVSSKDPPGRDRPPSAPSRDWSVSANARLRWFADYASVSWGGDAGADVGHWRLRAEALVSSSDDALGSASLGIAAAGVGYRVLEKQFGPLHVASYPMLAAGVTWLRGEATAAGATVTPVTGVYADVRLILEAQLQAAALAPTLSFEVGRASGYVARSEDRALGSTGGFFIGASLGGAY